jgi:hypothetical protein
MAKIDRTAPDKPFINMGLTIFWKLEHGLLDEGYSIFPSFPFGLECRAYIQWPPIKPYRLPGEDVSGQDCPSGQTGAVWDAVNGSPSLMQRAEGGPVPFPPMRLASEFTGDRFMDRHGSDGR